MRQEMILFHCSSQLDMSYFYFNCPILWVSHMQTEISLFTIEAEYVALSQAMRDGIPFLDIMKELDSVFKDESPKLVIHCT